MKRAWLVMAAALVLVRPSMALAQAAPGLVNFQGRLTDNLNNPLSGSHSLDFQVYDDPAAGSLLWSETQAGVTVVNGVFAVQLGAVNPLTAAVFAGTTAYLQVAVDGTPLSPRSRLIASPYAFNAQSLQGRGYQAFVSTDSAAQVVAGTKTFTGALYVPAPAAAGQAANKAYVDAQVSGSGGWSLSGAVVELASPAYNAVVQSTLTVQGNAFSVGGSTFAVVSGNVGIGTGSPQSALDVRGGSGTQLAIDVSGDVILIKGNGAVMVRIKP